MALLTAIGAFFSWWFTGKQPDLEQKKMGQVVLNWEDSFRKVVIGLLRDK